MQAHGRLHTAPAGETGGVVGRHARAARAVEGRAQQGGRGPYCARGRG